MVCAPGLSGMALEMPAAVMPGRCRRSPVSRDRNSPIAAPFGSRALASDSLAVTHRVRIDPEGHTLQPEQTLDEQSGADQQQRRER